MWMKIVGLVSSAQYRPYEALRSWSRDRLFVVSTLPLPEALLFLSQKPKTEGDM